MRTSTRGRFACAACVASCVLFISGCDAPVAKDATPEERLAGARRSIASRQYETALSALEQIRDVTAGTKLGGDVLLVMAEAKFEMGEFAESDGLAETYLSLYPSAPSAPEALILRARSNLRMIQKTRLGLSGFERYVPADRDGAPIARAREFFALYLQRYPDGAHAGEASRSVTMLADREAEHELEVASFYLDRGRKAAALARALAVQGSGCSETVRAAALAIAQRARATAGVDGEEAP